MNGMQIIANIVAIPFTSVGLHGGMRGQKWLKERIEIFKNYTLKSLLNQEAKGFLTWFWFRPEERNNPLVKELDEYLTNINFAHIFTFHGLMYHDDKFTNFNLKTIIRNMAMMGWDCLRYKQWKSPIEILRHSFSNKNKTLLSRLDKALYELRQRLPKGIDWIYLTRIDSDDMFHKDVMKLIQGQLPQENRALIFEKGFILNKQTGQVADWTPTTCPPFWTIIFPFYMFFNPVYHLNYYKNYRSHESIPQIFDIVKLPDDNYLYLTHGKNISTYWYTNMYMVLSGHNQIGSHWNLNRLRTWWLMKKNPNLDPNIKRGIHPFIGRLYEGKEKEEILSKFGLKNETT